MNKLPKEYWTLEQAAKRLALRPGTLHHWTQDKRIQSRKFVIKIKSRSKKGKIYYIKHVVIGMLKTRVYKLNKELKEYKTTRHWCNAQDKKNNKGRYRGGANYQNPPPPATDKQIRKAIKAIAYTTQGMAKIARELNISYMSLIKRAKTIGAWTPRNQRVANYLQWDMPRIKRAIKKHENTRGSYKAAAKELNIPYTTLRQIAKALKIYKPSRGYCNLEDVLSGKHPAYGGSTLKDRLLAEKILPHKCNRCGRCTVYNHYTNKRHKVDLQIEHMNGNRHDHQLKPYAKTTNIELLCGLCHPHTPFYMGKNAGRYKNQLRKDARNDKR